MKTKNGYPDGAAYELEGVLADLQHAGTLDKVCEETITRSARTLIAYEDKIRVLCEAIEDLIEVSKGNFDGPVSDTARGALAFARRLDN